MRKGRCYTYSCDRYTGVNFLVDASMFCLTGGLWTIWIVCREMRRR